MKYPFVVLSLSSALLAPQLIATTLHADQNEATAKQNQESSRDQSDTVLDQMVVTANRYETPASEVGSSITVITAKEIEQTKQTTVKEVLRSVPGLDVVQTGSFGGTTSVSIRGANSNHTLVLLDGVELNDPSSTGGAFDFANLTTDNIDRIEILRGPQSTLYGSKAMGGVINIMTKRGKGKPSGFLSAEGGSYYTAKERAGISGGTDIVNYSLGISRHDTGGFSAADAKFGNTEKDPYQNTTVNSRIGINPLNNLNVDFILNYQNSRASIDGSDWTTNKLVDFNKSFIRTEQLSFRTQADLSLFNDLWQQKLGVSFNDITRDNISGAEAANLNTSGKTGYHGQTVKLDWQHVLNLHKTNTLIIGADRQEENMKSNSQSGLTPTTYADEKYASIVGVYIQDQVRLWDSWVTTAGVRVDDHSQFGTQATYRFTTAYDLKKTGTIFKGSYGTGFKAPSLYQMYDPTNGNSSLNPEKSTGWDIGIEQSLNAIKTTVGVTYFDMKFDNLIDWQSTGGWSGKYFNINKAKTRGLETFVTVKPITDLSIKGSYTYTYAKDESTGLDLVNRPKNKFALNTNYGFWDKKANVNVGLIYAGTKMGQDWSTYPATNVKMKNYVIVNLAASYDVTKSVQLFGRIDNLFDRQYEEVYGYGTSRFAAYGGVKLRF